MSIRSVACLGTLALAGCAARPGGLGEPFPRDLEPGAMYRMEVVNHTACPLTVLLGPRIQIVARNATEIALLQPYDRTTFEFVPGENDRLGLAFAAGQNFVGGECEVRTTMPITVRVLEVTPPATTASD